MGLRAKRGAKGKETLRFFSENIPTYFGEREKETEFEKVNAELGYAPPFHPSQSPCGLDAHMSGYGAWFILGQLRVAPISSQGMCRFSR